MSGYLGAEEVLTNLIESNLFELLILTERKGMKAGVLEARKIWTSFLFHGPLKIIFVLDILLLVGYFTFTVFFDH